MTAVEISRLQDAETSLARHAWEYLVRKRGNTQMQNAYVILNLFQDLISTPIYQDNFRSFITAVEISRLQDAETSSA